MIGNVRDAPEGSPPRAPQPPDFGSGDLRRERLLTPHKRKVLRKRITLAETAFGASFVVLVALATLWIGAQGDNFDPADRDIDTDLLEQQSVDEALYVPPLKRWTDPAVQGLPGGQGGAAALPDLSPFPAGLLDGGWRLDGRVESYDESNVYEKINGAAEQYRAFGFRALHYVTLAKGSRFMNVEIYDQGEFRNVIGIFAAQRAPGREVKSRGEIYYYETPVGVIGGYRNLYFKVSGSDSDPAVIEKAATLIDALPQMETSESMPPRAFAVLTATLAVPFDGLEYQKQNVFHYDFLGDFWFGAVEGGGDARYFIHETPGPAEAAALFRRIDEEHRREYAPAEEAASRVVMQHRFLKTFFALEQRGAYLYGVDGAADLDAAAASLGRLDEALANEGA